MRNDYSGFDQIYSRVPEISRYQLNIFFIASFPIILSGLLLLFQVLKKMIQDVSKMHQFY